jgi:hypothetical protein
VQTSEERIWAQLVACLGNKSESRAPLGERGHWNRFPLGLSFLRSINDVVAIYDALLFSGVILFYLLLFHLATAYLVNPTPFDLCTHTRLSY